MTHPYKKLVRDEQDSVYLPFFLISLILTIPVWLAAAGKIHFTSSLVNSWTQFIFATLVVFWCGWTNLKNGWNSLVTRKFNMFTLVMSATLITYILGMIILFFPTLFPPLFNFNMNVEMLFNVAATTTTFVLLEQVIETYVLNKANHGLKILHPLVSSFDKLTDGLTNCVVISALLFASVALILHPDIANYWISAISILLIANSRIFILAAPFAILFGMQCAKKAEIFLQEASYLEQISKINLLIIDESLLTEQFLPAIKLFRDDGIYIVMMTDNNQNISENVNKMLHVDAVETITTSQQKQNLIEKLKQQKFRTAFVNLHSETGMTLEIYADSNTVSLIQFSQKNIFKIVFLRVLSIKVIDNIFQSILIGVFYNIIFIAMAAGVYSLLTQASLNPIIAITLMCTSTIIVMMNAMRLESIKLQIPK